VDKKRIAFLVEGQTELIFIRYLLPHIIDYRDLSIECLSLHAHREENVHHLDYPNDRAHYHFFILNVGNDHRVLSAIKDRESTLIESGYECIIGLRDMYSRAYREEFSGRHAIIDEAIIQKFIDGARSQIALMHNSGKIKFHFSIMEIEAWFLTMYELFEKVDPVLTAVTINNRLGYDLSMIDPQREFLKPSDFLNDIFEINGSGYGKKMGEVITIAGALDHEIIHHSLACDKCQSFKDFYHDIESLIETS